MKKTRGQKSRATVPLSPAQEICFDIEYMTIVAKCLFGHKCFGILGICNVLFERWIKMVATSCELDGKSQAGEGNEMQYSTVMCEKNVCKGEGVWGGWLEEVCVH
jgi:hypothetical protein